MLDAMASNKVEVDIYTFIGPVPQTIKVLLRQLSSWEWEAF